MINNRYLNILVPGIFLPTCLGTVYNFSQYSKNIMELFDITKFQTDIGFTLIIFFLGMYATVFGRQVELNPKRMARVSTVLFALGMALMYVSLKFAVLPLYYVACSFMGAGTGIGYVSPIKQLMSNFSDHKGLSSGLAITGFGLGKFVAAPAIEYLLNTVSLHNMFLILGGAFFAIMSLCTWLFKPNPTFIPTKYTVVPIKDLFKSKLMTMEYVSIWMMFCINISCGLAIISQEKGLLSSLGFTQIALIMSATAVANILGRFGMSTLSDRIGRKASYHWVCSIAVLASFLCFTNVSWLALVGILMIEFSYGGNFSSLPSLLSKRFGSSCVSTVHGATLSGWAMAGIFGPVLANTIPGNNLYLVLAGLYIVGFTMMEIFVKRDNYNTIT